MSDKGTTPIHLQIRTLVEPVPLLQTCTLVGAAILPLIPWVVCLAFVYARVAFGRWYHGCCVDFKNGINANLKIMSEV